MTRVALSYSRQSKSNVDDGTDSVSIAAQQRRITDYASRNDLHIEQGFQDVDVRGTTVHRVGLDAMLARIDQGGIDAVIVYDVSRLSRDVELFVGLIKRFKARGIEFISTREPAGEDWLLNLFSSLAARDRGLLSVRIADAMRERAKTGQHVGQVPLGYARENQTQPDGRVIRRLIPNEFAPLIVELFARYDAGESVVGVARWLNEPGHPKPKRAARWSGPSVNYMLRNRAYVGDVIVRQNTKYPAVTYQDAHTPIVDRALFDRVQARMDLVGNRDAPRIRKTGRHWLEGRVWCACGAPMYLFEKRHVSDGHLMRQWSCRHDNATRSLTNSGGVCDRTRSTVGNRRVEPQVLRQFMADMARMATIAPADLMEKADRPDTMRDALRARLVSIRASRRRIASTIALLDDPSHLIADDNTLAAEERSVETQLAETPVLVTVERLSGAVAITQDIRGLLPVASRVGDQSALHEVANQVGLRVEIDGDVYGVTLGYAEPWGRLV